MSEFMHHQSNGFCGRCHIPSDIWASTSLWTSAAWNWPKFLSQSLNFPSHSIKGLQRGRAMHGAQRERWHPLCQTHAQIQLYRQKHAPVWNSDQSVLRILCSFVLAPSVTFICMNYCESIWHMSLWKCILKGRLQVSHQSIQRPLIWFWCPAKFGCRPRIKSRSIDTL